MAKLALNLIRLFCFFFFLLTFSVSTSAACEKLERDRNELQVAYEGFLQKLNQQHHNDLAELEERLKQFYTAECEKLQSICIEEAEKYKAQLQEQVCNIFEVEMFSSNCFLLQLSLQRILRFANNGVILSNVKLHYKNITMLSCPDLKLVFKHGGDSLCSASFSDFLELPWIFETA